jgi:hypothetical protein
MLLLESTAIMPRGQQQQQREVTWLVRPVRWTDDRLLYLLHNKLSNLNKNRERDQRASRRGKHFLTLQRLTGQRLVVRPLQGLVNIDPVVAMLTLKELHLPDNTSCDQSLNSETYTMALRGLISLW